MSYKYCNTCTECKHPSQFNKDKTGQQGVRGSCKKCESEYNKLVKQGIKVYDPTQQDVVNTYYFEELSSLLSRTNGKINTCEVCGTHNSVKLQIDNFGKANNKKLSLCKKHLKYYRYVTNTVYGNNNFESVIKNIYNY